MGNFENVIRLMTDEINKHPNNRLLPIICLNVKKETDKCTITEGRYIAHVMGNKDVEWFNRIFTSDNMGDDYDFLCRESMPIGVLCDDLQNNSELSEIAQSDYFAVDIVLEHHRNLSKWLYITWNFYYYKAIQSDREKHVEYVSISFIVNIDPISKQYVVVYDPWRYECETLSMVSDQVARPYLNSILSFMKISLSHINCSIPDVFKAPDATSNILSRLVTYLVDEGRSGMVPKTMLVCDGYHATLNFNYDSINDGEVVVYISKRKDSDRKKPEYLFDEIFTKMWDNRYIVTQNLDDMYDALCISIFDHNMLSKHNYHVNYTINVNQFLESIYITISINLSNPDEDKDIFLRSMTIRYNLETDKEMIDAYECNTSLIDDKFKIKFIDIISKSKFYQKVQ